MSGRRLARAAVAIAVLGAGAATYRWWYSPERQIARILTAVDSALSHEERGTSLDALTAVAALQQYLAADVAIDTGRPSGAVSGRQEAISTAARIRAATPMLRIQFFDTRIAFESGTRAAVHSTAEVTTANEAGEAIVDVFQVSAIVEERDGQWVVTAARRESEGEGVR